MIKVVSSRKAKLPVDYYLRQIHEKEQDKQINQLMIDPSNKKDIDPKDLSKYLGIVKRELKKQQIEEEKQSPRSL